MPDEPRQWAEGGRTLRWRAGLLLGGLVLAGYGAALVCWPWLLGWTVAALFGLVGLICVISALFARGRRR